MDLKLYYQKIREQESNIADEFPVIISHETADGGKPDQKTEVPRRLAAKMVVEGLARLASRAEAQAFRDVVAKAKQKAEQLAAASAMQLTMLAASELEKLKSTAKSRE